MYPVEEFLELLSEIGIVDEFFKILINSFGGNFLMSVVEDEILESSLQFIISGLILEEFPQMGVFDGGLVVVLEGLPRFGSFHGLNKRYL